MANFGLTFNRVLGFGFLALSLGACSPSSSLGQIDKNIFTPSCVFSSCHHAGAGAAQNLSLAMPSYASLVGVKSTAVPSKTLVIPGDADRSYLIEKLISAKPAAGVQMPQGFDPLPDDELTAIKQWIIDGAQND